MPVDHAARAIRQQVILELVLGETPIHSQGELVQLLAERGISTNQSSVSRDLKELRVVRVRGAYSAAEWDPLEEAMEFFRLGNFVRRASAAGPNLAVVKTRPGAGMIIGRAIEEEDWPEVVGTINGESTVFVATAEGGQERFLERIDTLRRASLSPRRPR
jgi:transcriptional regulator of arginine metabolism